MRGDVNMLALTRKKGEAIVIDDCIEIKIIEISGDKVKLGINAPKEISIYREEIYLQVLESNHKAAEGSAEALDKIKGLLKSK